MLMLRPGRYRLYYMQLVAFAIALAAFAYPGHSWWTTPAWIAGVVFVVLSPLFVKMGLVPRRWLMTPHERAEGAIREAE